MKSIGLVQQSVLTIALIYCAYAMGCGGLDCKDADREAQALITQSASCTVDDDCRILSLHQSLEGANKGGVCVQSFLCAVAIRKDVDEKAFIDRARDIVRRRECDECPVAKCRVFAGVPAICDAQLGRCSVPPL